VARAAGAARGGRGQEAGLRKASPGNQYQLNLLRPVLAEAATVTLPDPCAAFFFSSRCEARYKAYIWRSCAIHARNPASGMTIDEILDNFSFLDEWDDRYRYIIELGRTLAPLPEQARVETNKVQGCASQVWLITQVKPDGAAGPVLSFVGDSDAHIVRGLIAILFAIYSDKSARDILSTDALALFDQLGLREHLTPQRSNGLRSMVERIRADARAALAEAA
jgi:cysteine desulfuration protein SufE